VKRVVILVGGCLFGFGLAWSGMTQQEVVLSFLQLDDLGLMLVMAGAIAVTALAFYGIPRLLGKPPLAAVFEGVCDRLDRRTMIGAVLFGLGWGVSGLCPGSALASLGTGNYPVLLGLGGMFAGAWIQGACFPEPD
jgi:uncharacterized membrane protein YedE/YeeE